MRSRVLMLLAAVFAFSLGSLAPAQASETLERILSEKKIKAGVVPGWPRFIVWDPEKEEYTGFLADEIRNFEESTGIEVEYVTTNWGGIISGLQAGKYDVIMGGISATPQRIAAVAFSDPYAYWYTSALVEADSEAGNFDDLNMEGKTVSVVSGTAMHEFARKVFDKAEIKSFNDSSNAVLEVLQGRADAYIGDSFTNHVRGTEREELKMLELGPEVTEWGGMSHAVRYSDTDVLTLFNAYINSMKLTNWYRELTDKYDLPPGTPTGPQ